MEIDLGQCFVAGSDTKNNDIRDMYIYVCRLREGYT